MYRNGAKTDLNGAIRGMYCSTSSSAPRHPPLTQHITATGRGQRIVVHRVEHTRLIRSALLAFFLIMVVHGMNAKPRLFEFSELSMIALDLPRESAAVLWIY